MSWAGPGSCSFQLSGALGGLTGHGNGFVGPKAEDLGQFHPDFSPIIPTLAQCIPDCAMTGGFHSPVPQEGCSGATTATQQPGWELGAEPLSFHEPSTFTREPLNPRASFLEQLSSGSVSQDGSEAVPFLPQRKGLLHSRSVVQSCKYPSWIKAVHHSLPHLQSAPTESSPLFSPPCCLALYFGG